MNERASRILVEDGPLVPMLRAAFESEGWEIATIESPAFAPDIVLIDLEESLSYGVDALVDHLRPMVRRLGLAPTSHRYGDLVLDDATAEVWRADERVLLTPIEFEMLRALVEKPGLALSLGQVLRALTVRGARVPRELAHRMLDRMKSLVNGVSAPLARCGSAITSKVCATPIPVSTAVR